MGEAILAKIGVSDGGTGGGAATEGVISTNGVYTVTKSGNYRITCVGGGQGGHGLYVNMWYDSSWEETFINLYGGNGGDSGLVASSVIKLNAGDVHTITIGAGGAAGKTTMSRYDDYNASNGGTTSFGSLLSSSGGVKNNGEKLPQNSIDFRKYSNRANGAVLWLDANNGYINTTKSSWSTLLPYANGGIGGGIYVKNSEGWYQWNNATPGMSGCILIKYTG